MENNFSISNDFSKKNGKIYHFSKKLQIVTGFLKILKETCRAAPRTPQCVLAITFLEIPRISGTARVNVILGAFPPFSYFYSQRQ
jgi:hypothetical protein